MPNLLASLRARLPEWSGWFAAAAAVEGLSWATYAMPALKPWALGALALAGILIGLRDLRVLFALLLLEMCFGGHGHLVSAQIGGFTLSLRMALFGALLLGWIVHALKGCSRLLHAAHARVFAPLLLLVAALSLASLRGTLGGAGLQAVFSDANGYAYILLIPIALDLLADRSTVAWLAKALSGGLAWLAAKTLILVYLFAHDFGPWLATLKHWQRTHWLTEITLLPGGAVRVFSASDVFLLIGIFVGTLLTWHSKRKGTLLWTAFIAAAFFASLSRSFWLGAFVSAAFMLPVFVRLELVPFARLPALFLRAATVAALGAGLLALAAFFPAPQLRTSADAAATYGGRALDLGDAAVTSRWNMLNPLRDAIAASPLLGAGFGATIGYQSDDPRMHDLHPGGFVVTGAVEWQYLEVWWKTGVLGLAAFVWLWWRIGRFGWKALTTARESDRLLAAGLLLAFLAFVAANIFTPYLNHPLGWMFLALVIAGFHAAIEHERVAESA